MSPAIRDLKGRPVDEVVTSRDTPGLPEPGPAMVERAAVRQAVEKVQAQKQPHAADAPEKVSAPPMRVPASAPVSADLPTDIESCLRDVEASMALLQGQCQHLLATLDVMREQVGRVRARVEKDAAKLARLNDLLKEIDAPF